MYAQHKDQIWIYPRITRSGISHAREGENPLSHTKTDVWRLTHLHEAGRLDRLSVSSTHSYMMKTNRGMFPGQRREMEFSWFARKENLPRRVWQLPSVCTTVSSLGGGIFKHDTGHSVWKSTRANIIPSWRTITLLLSARSSTDDELISITFLHY